MKPDERAQLIVNGFLSPALADATPREKKLIRSLQNLAYGKEDIEDFRWSKKAMRRVANEALQEFIYDFMKEQYPVKGRQSET